MTDQELELWHSMGFTVYDPERKRWSNGIPMDYLRQSMSGPTLPDRNEDDWQNHPNDGRTET